MGEDDKKVVLITPEAVKDLTRQVAESASDPGKMTALLTQLQDGYAAIFAEHGRISEQNKTFTAENEKLRQYNMELFMNYGQKLVEDNKKPEQTTKQDERARTITVSDLFKED